MRSTRFFAVVAAIACGAALIRPAAAYVGPHWQPYVAIGDR